MGKVYFSLSLFLSTLDIHLSDDIFTAPLNIIFRSCSSFVAKMELRSRRTMSPVKGGGATDDAGGIPPTYFVVCLHEKCSQEAADFMTQRLRAPQAEGGAELVVHQEEMKPDGLIIHVSADKVVT